MATRFVLFATIFRLLILENCYACSQVFTAQSGDIQSPKDANGKYPNYANCTYTIRGGSNVHYIHFLFKTFELESNFDFLYVGNQMFTGELIEYSNTYYIDDIFTLRFTSDRSGITGGFRLRYRMIRDTYLRSFTSLTGTIESPKDTASIYYPDNAIYIYLIKRAVGDISSTQIIFEKFSLELNYDYLYVGHQAFTGNKTGYKAYYDFHNDLKLVFTSDGSRHEYAGFKIRYRVIPDCKKGHYGPTCTLRCSSGCSDVCHKITGRCNCKVGWTGAKCDAACPTGTYDSYCTKTCSAGCVGGSCNKLDGSCPCRSGYTGSRCTSQCFDGHYGLNCASQCSSGCLDVCNKETGTCTCKTGWTGIQCETVCPSGTYGSYCAKSCSPGCVDGSCETEDGSCSCRLGYTGAGCKDQCSNEYYGLNCTSRCSSGCLDVCNKETGTCTCKTGWTGTHCETACPYGTNDSYCTKTCCPRCVNGSCDQENGTCSYKPEITTANNDDGTFDVKLIAAVTGGSVGVALLITAVLAICCCFRRKRARNEETNRPKSLNEMKTLHVKENKAIVPGNEAIYDLPIEEDLGKTDRYENLKYSGGQKSGSSRPVSISGDAENDAEYVNFSMQKNEVKSGRKKRQQCYENHAIQSGDSEM